MGDLAQHSSITRISGPFTVTSSTQEVKTFNTGWTARIESGPLVVGVERWTYNGPYLEVKNVYAPGAWAKLESVDMANEGLIQQP